MKTHLCLLALAVPLVLAGVLPGQPSLAGPRLFPRGARAPGIQETVFDVPTGSYLFTLKSETGAIVVQYRLPLGHPNMVSGVLRIEETVTGVVPIAGGGLMYRNVLPGPANVGRLIPAYDLAFSSLTDPLHRATLLGHSLNTATGVVSVSYRDEYLVVGLPVPVPAEKTYALRLVGKSLEIHATSDFAVNNQPQYNHAGFAFGPGEGLPQPNLAFHMPYMDMFPVFVGQDVFVTRILDWYRSNGSEGVSQTGPSGQPTVNGTSFQGELASAVYRNDSSEINAPIDETAFITVSRDVADVFPVIDRPPSAYRRHVADRAVSQAGLGELYQTNAAWVAQAKSLGIADMAHIKWDWSKWPLTLNDPDLLPAAPGVPCGVTWGSQSDWLAYANLAAQANWTFAPYFEESGNDPGYLNQVLVLPGSAIGSVTLTANPAYFATASVRDAAGVAKLGWNTELNLANTNLGGQVPPVGHKIELLGPHLRAGYLTVFANAIHGVGGYTPFPVAGAHTDAAAGVPDGAEIDQRKLSGFPRTIAENLQGRDQSFSALKDGMDGPLFGENSHWRYKAFETYAAGLIDGTSRKIPIHWAQGPPEAENKDYLVVPDFELGEVMTKATGFFGMGWESHFQYLGPWGDSDAFVDPWHTTLLSYGHAPYFGTSAWDWRRNIRSYFLCHGVSEAMRTSTVTAVRYEDALGVELDLNAALAQAAAGAMDLRFPHLVLRFANGLEFKANHDPAGTWRTLVLGQQYHIPTDGFVAAAPGGLLALSAINPATGARIDYAFNPGHSQVIDLRGRNQSFNGFPGTLLPVPPSLTQFNGVNTGDMVFVHDLRENRAIYGAGMISGAIGLGPSPAPVSLAVEIDDTATLSSGRPRLGVRAVLTDAIGNRRDVTGLCAWTSSNPALVTVNRFGGLAMLAVGSVAITANLASAGLTASHTIQATRAPVLTPVQLVAVTTTRAFLSFTTDAACTTTIQLYNTATGATSSLAGRPDPARKVHHFPFQSLTSLTTYVATPTAVNAGTLTTTGAPFPFTTL